MPRSLRHLPITVLAAALILPGAAQSSLLTTARRDRDHANLAGLQALAKQADAQAAKTKSATDFATAAQLDAWACEAALDRGNTAAVTPLATAGATAAQQAIKLDPNSSEAYRLRGTLLGELISTGGMAAGMQYGAESTQDADKAIQLDPKNARALVDRSISYIYTPEAFGGSVTKAIAMLQKAAALDPKLDTAHIWLAQAYLQAKQPAAALREAQTAEKLNPGRAFTQGVLHQIQADPKK